MMDALECYKQHGRPVTAKDVEKSKLSKEREIIAEAVFFLGGQYQTEPQSWMKVCQIYFKIPLSLLVKHRVGVN